VKRTTSVKEIAHAGAVNASLEAVRSRSECLTRAGESRRKPPHDPRSYLLLDGDDVARAVLGEIETCGPSSEDRSLLSSRLLSLPDDLLHEYRQYIRAGFHAVLVIDADTGVTILEMRKRV